MWKKLNEWILREWYLADFEGWSSSWINFESLFTNASFALKIRSLPQLGTEPDQFEFFARICLFLNFGHTPMILVSNCRYWLPVSKKRLFYEIQLKLGDWQPLKWSYYYIAGCFRHFQKSKICLTKNKTSHKFFLKFNKFV